MALKQVSMRGKYALHATAKGVTSREATEYGTDERVKDHKGRALYLVEGLAPVVADSVVDLKVYTPDSLNLEVQRGEEFAASGILTVKPVVGKYGLTGSYVVDEHAVGKENKNNG